VCVAACSHRSRPAAPHVGDELLRKFDDIVRGLDESGASREIATYNIGRTNGARDEHEHERASDSGDDSDALSEDSGEPHHDERVARARQPQQQQRQQQQQPASKHDASLDLLEASADSAAHVMARAPERPAYAVASSDAPPARLPPAPPQASAAAPLQLYGGNSTIVVATATAIPSAASASALLAGRRVASGAGQVQPSAQAQQPSTNSAVQRAVASPAFGDVQESVRRKFEELLDLSSADQWAPPPSAPVRAPMQASAMPTRALLPNAGSIAAQAPVQAQLVQAAAAGRAHATAVAAGMGRLSLHQQAQAQQPQQQPQQQQQYADGANSVDAVDSDHEHSRSDDVGSDDMSTDSETREHGRGRSRGGHLGKSPRSQRSFTSTRSGRSDAIHGRLYETGLRQYQQRELSPRSPRSHASSMTPRTRTLSETRFQGARAEQYAAMLYQEGMKHKADRERLQRRVAKQRARQEMQGVTFHPVRVTEPEAARQQRRREREVAVVFDRLYTMGKAHRRYIEQLSERFQAEEIGKLTFTPQINEDGYTDTLSHNGAAANGDIHTRLYTLARRSMVVRESAQREREQNELAPCTFTPEINRAKTPERSTSALETSNRLYKLGQARAVRRARASERSASDLPQHESVGSARRTSRASIDRLAMPRAIATPRRSSDSVTPAPLRLGAARELGQRRRWRRPRPLVGRREQQLAAT
jgi:hypothetical protein